MATCVEFLSVLRNSSPQVHIFHNQTQVYSEHQALGMYYDDVLDIIDRITETYTALYGEVTGYKSAPYRDYVDKEETITYFKTLYSYVQKNRSVFTDSFLQNIVDELSELIAQTIFRLNLNKI
jgi:spore coat polysaccharide biosynthesis protein SpsF (cytidylyltransferase family)